MNVENRHVLLTKVTFSAIIPKHRKGWILMVERQIKLTANEDVKEFVNQASKCDFDIDVFYNRVVIDAKSILGVLSMDLTKVLTVRCNGHDERFDEFLNKFAVA